MLGVVIVERVEIKISVVVFRMDVFESDLCSVFERKVFSCSPALITQIIFALQCKHGLI